MKKRVHHPQPILNQISSVYLKCPSQLILKFHYILIVSIDIYKTTRQIFPLKLLNFHNSGKCKMCASANYILYQMPLVYLKCSA